MKLGAHDLIIDGVKLALGVVIYSAVDPATKTLGGWGYVLSLVCSIAGTLLLSWLLLNQSF